MPSSSKEGKSQTVEWIKEIKEPLKRILDLGTGKGTYSRLFRKHHTTQLYKSYWIGVEAWAPYIDQFDLKHQYHEIINEDIRKVDYQALFPIDLTFAGDVLEHITKEESINVVDSVLTICPRLIISIPIIHYPQDAFEGNHFEIHVKDDWSHEEMMDTFPQIKKSWTGREIGCYLLSSI